MPNLRKALNVACNPSPARILLQIMDIKIIKECYSGMYDDEILQFAEKNGLNLSSDAFLILREELKRRKIGQELLNNLEHEIILQSGILRKSFIEKFNTKLFDEAVNYALTQKEKGSSNYEIYSGLIEMGITEEYSNYIVNKIDDWTLSLKADSSLEIQTGIVMLLIGFGLLYITIEIEHFEAGAILFILISIFRIFSFSWKRNRYKKILLQIQNEMFEPDNTGAAGNIRIGKKRG